MNYYYNQIGINHPFYSLSGSNYICSGQTGYYSVANLPGVSSYFWETSSNLSITGGQGTNSISVQASNNDGGYVKVTPGCGYNSRTRTIGDFYSFQINGYDTACAQNGFNYNYNVAPLSGASYYWTITDGIINYGQGTTNVNIKLLPNPSNQTWLTLQVTGPCSSITYRHKIITHGDPPPAEQCFAPDPGKPFAEENMQEFISEEEIKLYPNPAVAEVSIFWPLKEIYGINVRDAQGRILFQQYNISENKFHLNLQNYPTGIYFIYLTVDNATIIKKLIIK
nr:T9SS type A sorting domain-containing protein [Aequorivita echinoideorum]